MAKNNSSNQEYTDQTNGFTISGGSFPASLSVTAGTPSIAGNSSGLAIGFPTSSIYNNLVGKDINGNASISNIVSDYNTTVTSGGTLTLTAASARRQFFTGSSSHSVVLPNASGTLVAGHSFYFKNDSTQPVAIRYNDGVSLFKTVYPMCEMVVTCISVSSTNGSWDCESKGTDGVVPSVNFIGLTSTKTLTSNTNQQPIFTGTSAGGLTVGALNVYSSCFYTFECVLYLTSMSATSGNMRFGLLPTGSTASFTAVNYVITGVDSATPSTPAAISTSVQHGTSAHIVANTTGNIVIASTGSAIGVTIKGSFLVNAGGTIIPHVQLTTASAAVIAAGSYFRCDQVATNTAPYQGGAWT